MHWTEPSETENAAEEKALKQSMQAKSKEFVAKGAEGYAKA